MIFALDFVRVELPLVFQQVELLALPVSGSTTPTCSPSFRNTPFMRTFGLDCDDVVIDEEALRGRPARIRSGKRRP